MDRHRKLLVVIIVLLLVIAAVGFVVYHRIAEPARAVLLLPDGNLLLYANLSPMHIFDIGPMPNQTDPEYQDFIQNTGFHFEKDLDTIAVSFKEINDRDPEPSVVLVGHFDQNRLANYLHGRASGTESYKDKSIFVIHHGNDLVRACLLDSTTVALTIMQSADSIHQIIDKSLGSESSGPSLMQYYQYVPFGSLAWVMLRAPEDVPSKEVVPGVDADFLRNTVSILSVRYTGSIRIKLDIISQSDERAKQVEEAANTLLAFARMGGASISPSGPDKDVKSVFDNIQVQQAGRQTTISAVVPQSFVQKMSEKIKNPMTPQ